ncbi:Cyclin-D-2 [Tetrabaena socialis]|uniref:Cyclin-D-2 n=1 Tax=Tetrabaena socialis TaxID=47790 RepID=A0A2J8A6W2_9CHLO|nr:Cyclin-D-2 [Tetrabaena socialis]|eukprot:PNH08276.1 Cyclin-D-2 [Tetrabaena socialis]
MEAVSALAKEAPQMRRLLSGGDDAAASWSMDSAESVEPWLPFSTDSADSLLACDEDESSLELPGGSPELARSLPGGDAPFSTLPIAGASHMAFMASDTRETIRNELARLNELRYAPDRPEAQRFACCDRPRVVSWMVEVVTAVGLSEETLHSAVSLLDRFVQGTETLPPEHVLQLLALACVSIAAKHEEVAQHRADDWVGLAVDSDNNPLYLRDDLQRMEWLLLETVEWRIRVPSALTFLRHYHHALAHGPASPGVVPSDPAGLAAFKACSNFLAELSLMYDTFLSYGYSTVAAACLVLAEWTSQGAAPATPAGPAGPGGAAVPAAPAAAPVIRTVAALTAVAGVDVAALAPNLASCVEVLHQLHSRATTGGHPGGLPPRAAELGLLAPVVMRYQPPNRR